MEALLSDVETHPGGEGTLHEDGIVGDNSVEENSIDNYSSIAFNYHNHNNSPPVSNSSNTIIGNGNVDMNSSIKMEQDGRTIVSHSLESVTESNSDSNSNYSPLVINGVVYNNRGYEVCGVLNQHNKPCQRIGRCPFHPKDGSTPLVSSPTNNSSTSTLNPDSDTEKNFSLPTVVNTSSPPPPLPSNSNTNRPLSNSNGLNNTEKKDTKPPMKTPYKQGWTKEEHIRFLNGLQIHGKGAWKEIAAIVHTRSPTQIQSHAQKYYLRQKQPVKNKRSIHDITIQDLQEMYEQDPSLKQKHLGMINNVTSNNNSHNNNNNQSNTLSQHSNNQRVQYQYVSQTSQYQTNDMPLIYYRNPESNNVNNTFSSSSPQHNNNNNSLRSNNTIPLPTMQLQVQSISPLQMPPLNNSNLQHMPPLIHSLHTPLQMHNYNMPPLQPMSQFTPTVHLPNLQNSNNLPHLPSIMNGIPVSFYGWIPQQYSNTNYQPLNIPQLLNTDDRVNRNDDKEYPVDMNLHGLNMNGINGLGINESINKHKRVFPDYLTNEDHSAKHPRLSDKTDDDEDSNKFLVEGED